MPAATTATCTTPNSSPGLKLQPKLITREGDVTAGALKVNDAYDLTLYEMPNGQFELAVFMKIQFFFEDGKSLKWTDKEKKQFMQDWKVAVQTAWSGTSIHTTKNARRVSVKFDFAIQQGGWMLDHWEITVTKIPAGTFQTSYVNPKWGNVVLDSEDLTSVPKGNGQMQRGAVHEFGHMLGLVDEYHASSSHTADYASVMHSGETKKPRHVETLRTWVIRKLKRYGIE